MDHRSLLELDELGSGIHTSIRDEEIGITFANENVMNYESTESNAIELQPEPKENVLCGSTSTLFRCPICYEQIQYDMMKHRDNKAGASSCNHKFCHECLYHYIKTNMNPRQIPCFCPMIRCEEHLSTELVRAVLLQPLGGSQHSESVLKENKDWVKLYERKERIMKDPTVVECLKCQEVFVEADLDAVDLECTSCSHTFCRLHGDMHSTMTCDEFRRSEGGRQYYESEQIMDRMGTKKCSQCGIRTKKVGGCRWVYCKSCNNKWCWRCGHQKDCRCVVDFPRNRQEHPPWLQWLCRCMKGIERIIFLLGDMLFLFGWILLVTPVVLLIMVCMGWFCPLGVGWYPTFIYHEVFRFRYFDTEKLPNKDVPFRKRVSLAVFFIIRLPLIFLLGPPWRPYCQRYLYELYRGTECMAKCNT